jgi:hypothetical protein
MNTSSLHYQRLAKSWKSFLIKRLFLNTNLSVKQEDLILSFFGIHHPTYIQENFHPLILELSEYPIDYLRAAKYLSFLENEFLSDTNQHQLSGELLLVLLIELQAAHRRPRIISIESILQLTTANWIAKNRELIIQNHTFKLTKGIATLIAAFMPISSKQHRKLFDLSRSWINKKLREINTHLGYDWENDPVTAQTFLTQPHEWLGKRGKPLLWRVASRVQRFYFYMLRVTKIRRKKDLHLEIPFIKGKIEKNQAVRYPLSFWEIIANLPHQTIKRKIFIMKGIE